MTRNPRPPGRWPPALVLAAPVLLVLLALALGLGSRPALALPEYATRTGETCAVCHVNPGGGGPRTLRGLLWAARGRPDQVPTLPNMLIAPRVTDGGDLFDIACAGCHGYKGEGLYAMALTGTGIGRNSVRSFVLRGIPTIGMPSFEGQFTSDQIEALATFVAGLGSGEIAPPPDSYVLPAAQFRCGPRAAAAAGGCAAQPINKRGGN
jgi:mono/diheme cytochrome c family protein